MKKIYLILILILISGCIPSEKGSIDIYFCQVDDCEKVLVNLIEDSNKISCAFYDVDREIINLLEEKNAKLITDENRFDKGLMHNKFCIFDNEIILTGSMNPTYNGINKNDNNLIVIKSKTLAKNYNKEFDELYNYGFGKGQKVVYPKLYLNDILIENYFCPEDNCEDRVLETLSKAEESIYFMTFSFTSHPIKDFLLDSDLEIKGVFENMQAGSQWSAYEDLKEYDVIKDSNPNMMHHKVFIIDEEIVILGSYNPTKNANENNDENILIIYSEDVAEDFLEEFDRIFN